MEKVLITGASGKIGQLLVQHLKDHYSLVLTDIKEPAEHFGFPFTNADISDFDSIRPLFDGVDTVVHLAADYRREAPWESLLPNNIIGLYNAFEAMHQAGCKKMIYASSINSVDGYPDGIQIKTDMPVAPLNLYGASKAWGEAVGRFYSDMKGMLVYCLRLGAVLPEDSELYQTHKDPTLLRMVLTYRDMLNLFDGCLNTNHKFMIVHGISDNMSKRLDISDTKEKLGYAPVDDGFELAGVLQREIKGS
jgi:nucleoside-diphosphate-sugar epimerase